MRKHPPVIAALIALLALVHNTSGQLPAPAPFTIESGSSFSASSGSASTGPSKPASSPAAARIVRDLDQALEIIRGQHVGGKSLDGNTLVKSSINGMLAELDPHSTYFDPNEFRELLAEQDSEYSGTGSTISNFVRDGRLETFVLATHPDSAAAAANLQFGDRLIAVDGVAISGIPSDLVRDRVRGPRGSKVRITLERAATGKIETIELKRDRVSQPSIPAYFMLRDGVGYIGLTDGFSHTTSAELDTAMKDLHRRGMNSLVLDMRGNGGGVLQQAIKVAERFLQSGTPIISQRGRYEFENRAWISESRQPERLPLVVLVDGQTASASEVVAGALQDNDRAIIVGQNTFGKALVQNVLELPMGSGLTLTTARYYTPSGRSIQRSYAPSGHYDYFQHRDAEGAVSSQEPISRTITNRTMLGGRGIMPDEVIGKDEFSEVRAGLLDPMFFFVRDVVGGRIRTRQNESGNRKDQIRQSVIFGESAASPDLTEAFAEYAASGPWNISSATLKTEARFIQEQLSYQLALASFGAAAANQSRIVADADIATAIRSLPRAASLAAAADVARTSAANKKTRRVAFPTGQGRNRRN